MSFFINLCLLPHSNPLFQDHALHCAKVKLCIDTTCTCSNVDQCIVYDNCGKNNALNTLGYN